MLWDLLMWKCCTISDSWECEFAGVRSLGVITGSENWCLISLNWEATMERVGRWDVNCVSFQEWHSELLQICQSIELSLHINVCNKAQSKPMGSWAADLISLNRQFWWAPESIFSRICNELMRMMQGAVADEYSRHSCWGCIEQFRKEWATWAQVPGVS